MSEEITRQIRVYGIVQGVGFRPTVSRHAATRGIRGNVCNKGPYVEIFAQGKEADVDGFISDIEEKPPKRAAILKLLVESAEDAPEFGQFDIIESGKTKGEIFVSPDIAGWITALCADLSFCLFLAETSFRPFIINSSRRRKQWKIKNYFLSAK